MRRVAYCRRRVLLDAGSGALAGEGAVAELEGMCGGEWGWEDRFVLRPQGVEAMRLAKEGEARPVKGVRATPPEAWAGTPTPAGTRWGEVRELLACGDAEGALASRGMGILNWRRDHAFCGRCGARLEECETELMARRCPRCGQTEWPDVIPAVIVRLEREGKVLLARHTYRNPEMFACIAGHFEAGESAEECVRREVKEETGLETGRVEYLGSQHWPFPNMLMLAFRAECTGGELKLQAEELAEARWFPKGELPENMPQAGSVAWRLLKGDLAR